MTTTNNSTNDTPVTPVAPSGTTPPPSTPPPSTPPPTDPGGTTTPSLADAGTALLDQLIAWVAAIPELQMAEPGKRIVTASKGVKPAFITAAMAAVKASPELQAVNTFDTAAAQNAMDFLNAFEPIVVKLKSALQDLRFTIDSKNARTTAEALQIYDLAKGLVRNVSSSPLNIYINEMKTALGRTGSKKKGGSGTPTPAPAPAPAVSPAPATAASNAQGSNSVSVLATVPAGATHS